MQYLYDSGDAAVFMDSRDYEQIEIPTEVVGDAMQWLLPNDDVDILFVDERASDVQVPSAVDLKVTKTEPGRQGRHRLGRRQQAGDARVRGRRRRFRSSSRRARSSASTPAAASTSCPCVSAPTNAATRSSPATSAMSPATPLDELIADARPFTRELAEGVDFHREDLDEEIAAHSQGLGGGADRPARPQRDAGRALRDRAHRRPPPRSRSTRRSKSPRSTAAPTRPSSSTESSARSCASERGSSESDCSEISERLQAIAAELEGPERRRRARRGARPRGGRALGRGRRGSEPPHARGRAARPPSDSAPGADVSRRPARAGRRRPRASCASRRPRPPPGSRRRCATRSWRAASGSARCSRWPRRGPSAPTPSASCRPPARSS